jgi:hypothetical protein
MQWEEEEQLNNKNQFRPFCRGHGGRAEFYIMGNVYMRKRETGSIG